MKLILILIVATILVILLVSSLNTILKQSSSKKDLIKEVEEVSEKRSALNKVIEDEKNTINDLDNKLNN